MLDLRHPDCARELLVRRGVERANRLLALMGSAERAVVDEHVALLERLAPRLLPLADDAGLLVHRAMRDGRAVLLEGAQGSLLDVDHGTYPFVTSCNTTAGGAAVGAGIGPTAIDGVLGVVKAYTTRVGNGPLPTEAPSPLRRAAPRARQRVRRVTGRPRRCGWFDAMVVRYAARVNGLTGLAVTKLDVLDTFDEIPVCTGYELGGEPLRRDARPRSSCLSRSEPQYEVLARLAAAHRRARGGWPIFPPRRGPISTGSQALVGGADPYVSVGTRRDQIIEVEG